MFFKLSGLFRAHPRPQGFGKGSRTPRESSRQGACQRPVAAGAARVWSHSANGRHFINRFEQPAVVGKVLARVQNGFEATTHFGCDRLQGSAQLLPTIKCRDDQMVAAIL